MPVINGKYYMNPQYGKALERDRIADEEHRRVHGEPQPSWLDHHLGFADDSNALRQSNKQVTTHDTKHGKIPPQSKAENRSERGAMSYTEKRDGTVAEHEAMQSTVMNRVASGKRQYVDRGYPVDEHNVIRAGHQYQGTVTPTFRHYLRGDSKLPDVQNAVEADKNLRRTGKPTNDATSFIVNHGGAPPTDAQVHRLGNVMPAGRVGDVYLFKPAPPPARH
jgi:hypothetical protein